MKQVSVVSKIKIVTKLQNNKDSGKTNLEAEYIEIRRLKAHEPCYRCVYVAVHTYTIIQKKMRVKIIVRNVKSIRGSIARQLGSREE